MNHKCVHHYLCNTPSMYSNVLYSQICTKERERFREKKNRNEIYEKRCLSVCESAQKKENQQQEQQTQSKVCEASR